MGKALKNAIRLESNWNTFLKEHPEVEPITDSYGNITDIHLPSYCSIVLLQIFEGKVKYLYYLTPREYIKFPK